VNSTIFLSVIFSAFLHAGWNFLAKKVSGNLSVIYIGSWFSCLFFLPLVFFQEQKISEIEPILPYILLTGILTTGYYFTLAKAYEYGDISIVYPVARGSGVMGTSILAFWLLSEKFNLFSLSGIALICSGTFLLSYKRKISPKNYKDIFFALLIGLIASVSFIIDKMAMNIANPVIYIFGMYLSANILLTPYLLRNFRNELKQAWRKQKKYSLLIGTGSMLTYLIVLNAFSKAQVSSIVAIREIGVVIGSFLGIKFLGEEFNLRKGVGIVTIITGIIMIRVLK